MALLGWKTIPLVPENLQGRGSMLWCAHNWVWGARVGSGEGLATW